MEIHASASSNGPIFNGQAQRALGAFLNDAEQEVAKVGANVIRIELNNVLRHPTGYYVSQIQTDRAANGARIHDGGVIYGPWLEGVGSRNKTTRFKGYFTFRRMRQVIQSNAGIIAERVLHKYLGRMQ